MIRKCRQLPSRHLPCLLLLLPELRKGKFFNELKLIIGQLPAELLSLKPIDQLQFGNFEEIGVVMRVGQTL